MTMKSASFISILVTACLLIVPWNRAWSQSAWLAEPGQFILTPGFTFTSFDEFWMGDTLVGPLKAADESLDQYTAYLSLEYGVIDRLALDLSLGYTWTSSTSTFGEDDEGLTDVLFGLSYRIVEETEAWPIVAVRLGGIVAGSYEENTPFSAGDGAHGIEGSLLFGKTLGASGVGLYGDIGYRIRESPVPNEWFGSAGVFKQFAALFHPNDSLTIAAGYRHIESVDGLDIGGPGFNPALGSNHGFPALEEINQLIEGAIGYTDAGGRQYQFTAGHSVDGRNTGDKLILGFSVSFPF